MTNIIFLILLRLKTASIPEIFYKLKEFFYLLIIYIRTNISFDYSNEVWNNLNNLRLPQFNRSSNTPSKDGWTITPRQLQAIRDFEASQGKKFFWTVKIPAGFDIRAAWELARLQHLSAHWLRTGEPESTAIDVGQLTAGREPLFAWLQHNPFPLGPHYRSAMECGLRIPVFFYALKLLDQLNDTEKQQLLTAIYQHAWLIAHRLSLYSSCGNHTVCEALGLVFAGAIFGATAQGKKWLHTGIRLLEQELNRQVLSDGGPLEQAIKYHRFVLDAYWLVFDFLTKNGLYDCRGWLDRLRLGEQFLQAFSYAPGKLLAIGDSDDGHIVAPGIGPAREPAPPPRWSLKTFPEAGYTVIRGHDDLILTFDHGPLGMPPLYAHGHADALAITLSLLGKTILVDPGTYRYNGVPAWRRYFKSTRAHNTVTVDGQDQAVQETSFIWSHPYKATLLTAQETADGILLAGQHNGYAGLRAPVYHQRRIFFSQERYCLIHDTFQGEGEHTFELNYHLHPRAVVQPCQQGWEVRLDDVKVYIRLWAAANFRLACGEEQPPLGWYAPVYGQKVASSVLSCRQQGKPVEVSFLTGIYPTPSAPRSSSF